MYNISKTRTIAILLTFLLIACNSTTTKNSSESSTNVTQIKENQVSKPEIENAKRVVALTSLSADIIHRLDATKLVGIPGSSLLRKDERFAKLPAVSEGRTPPNIEKIVALKPDLVIGAVGFHEQTFKKLKDLGITTLASETNSWDALIKHTQELAQAINTDPALLLEKYSSFINDIPKNNNSLLVLVSSQPVLSPNKNSWTGDLLSKFNANNLTANLQGESIGQGYVTLSEEKIVQQNPEILLVVDPANAGVITQLKSKNFWNKLKATQKEQVYVFDYYGLVNPGSIDKIEETCKQLKKILE
ncbi:ABC transporter substrate-binding protein [Plectonema cf. radiosum LEGE 06105]|uniref:ABC transporter substrate-binding protein n=2 Tax=Plectonema TaxID=1183 RepID=A0A8J7K0D7_9CYAN|nr:ABC transporter substrate-binding protein [Plectonema cf. radiosum LEGE 06105]